MTSIPQAMQLYSRTSSGNEVVKRQGWCPECGVRSTNWRGIQPSLIDESSYWIFNCKSKVPHKESRMFRNIPDPTAPQDAEGFEAWKASQRLHWVIEKGVLQ